MPARTPAHGTPAISRQTPTRMAWMKATPMTPWATARIVATARWLNSVPRSLPTTRVKIALPLRSPARPKAMMIPAMMRAAMNCRIDLRSADHRRPPRHFGPEGHHGEHRGGGRHYRRPRGPWPSRDRIQACHHRLARAGGGRSRIVCMIAWRWSRQKFSSSPAGSPDPSRPDTSRSAASASRQPVQVATCSSTRVRSAAGRAPSARSTRRPRRRRHVHHRHISPTPATVGVGSRCDASSLSRNSR